MGEPNRRDVVVRNMRRSEDLSLPTITHFTYIYLHPVTNFPTSKDSVSPKLKIFLLDLAVKSRKPYDAKWPRCFLQARDNSPDMPRMNLRYILPIASSYLHDGRTFVYNCDVGK